jgi:hypothetical protein
MLNLAQGLSKVQMLLAAVSTRESTHDEGKSNLNWMG